MSETISYANEARKQVGKYLVEQCGYAKRTATRFYKNGDEILSYCYFEKSRGITQVEIGVSLDIERQETGRIALSIRKCK